ncbi:MAG: U32 family peptidase [Oscillospiraceae bacterium]|nr:U32 family peptidase [Oscillospiraceae bacterium]
MGYIELLAPAGGMKELKAAVQSGADAVYLGASSFSARAGAGNFDYDALCEAVRYCHVYGVKVHCALNTLIKESELEEAVEAAKKVYRCGVDALIIQDIGLAAHLRRLLPEIELHASTQMTVTSLEGVRYLEEHGFSRVVLARELSMREIEEIVKGAKAEIEVFVHGAICMCYSGQCLMSSILGGRSGNRGRCAQPCRLRYDLMENSSGAGSAYALSPKDMALIKHLNELRRIGVASLKIEGRLKSAEYVSAVTGIYRKYLDSLDMVTDEDMTELKNAFSRSGFTDGYFTRKTGRIMMAHDNPANNSGSVYTAAAKERASGKIVRRIPVHIFASLAKGDVLRVTAYDNDGRCVSVTGNVKAENAINKPLTAERLCEQLSKLGSTPFTAEDISAEVDEGITIPVKDINEVRRLFSAELEEARTGKKQGIENDIELQYGTPADPGEPYLTAEVVNTEQGRAVLEAGGVKRIYAPERVAAELLRYAADTEIVTKTADIFREEEPKTDHVSVSSPAAMRYYKERAAYGDFRLNIYNSLTIREFNSLKCVTLSPELNMREIEDITAHSGGTETEIIAYGHIPLMLMRNCPVRAMGKCQKGKRIYSLKDRKNIMFPIMCSDCESGDCKAVLLNSKPIFTADIIDSLRKLKINCLRLNFTVENSVQCGKIVNVYKDALNGKKIEAPAENLFTRGHLRRGVI